MLTGYVSVTEPISPGRVTCRISVLHNWDLNTQVHKKQIGADGGNNFCSLYTCHRFPVENNEIYRSVITLQLLEFPTCSGRVTCRISVLHNWDLNTQVHKKQMEGGRRLLIMRVGWG